jgi:REP element-mobilizing transposase RayT
MRSPKTIAFWRGNLPHWEVEGGRYFVTIHLAGAIPIEGQERIRKLAAEHDRIADADAAERTALERRIYAEMERWLDRTDFASQLHVPEIARMVMESIAFRHGREWNVFEYVIMPSHLHLFMEVVDGGLKHSLEQFKRWTGHEAAKLLRTGDQRFWQDEWFDHWSRSDEQDVRIAEYVRRNPEKARLVTDYREWPYGSWKAGLGSAGLL